MSHQANVKHAFGLNAQGFGAGRWAVWLILAALVIAVSQPGLNQGFGHLPEEARRISIAAEIASSGDLNPHWFGHPASLLHYLLAGLFGIWFTVGSRHDLRQQYLSDLSIFYLIGRFVARLAAIASIILTHELASRLAPPPWAFLAAALTVINPQFVVFINWARADHLLTCSLLLGTLLLLRLQRHGTPTQATALAALTGMAITYK